VPPKLSAVDAHQTVVKRVSRKQDDETHGGAWKVAFADFCLALMCLFLVLWLLASRNSERMQQLLKTAGADLIEEGQGLSSSLASGSRGSMLDRNPVPAHGEVQMKGKSTQSSNTEQPDADPRLSKSRYESAADMRELSRLIERIAAEVGLASNLHSAITPQGLRLMLHDTDSQGMFERGSASPSARMRELLRKLGPLFARMENQLIIVGHTDATAFADRSAGAFTNVALSNQRAMSARYQLLAGGMAEETVLQVSGMADRALLDPAHPQAAINRRIELMVLSSQQARQLGAMYGMPAGGLQEAATPATLLQRLQGQLAPYQPAAARVTP